jgi:hypothetical protein
LTYLRIRENSSVSDITNGIRFPTAGLRFFLLISKSRTLSAVSANTSPLPCTDAASGAQHSSPSNVELIVQCFVSNPLNTFPLHSYNNDTFTARNYTAFIPQTNLIPRAGLCVCGFERNSSHINQVGVRHFYCTLQTRWGKNSTVDDI